MSNNQYPPEISSRSRMIAICLVALGALTAVYGVFTAPERVWPNLLLNGVFFSSLAVSAMFFLATQRLTGARWSASLRRIPEAFIPALPVAAVLMMVLYFGWHTLYPWSRAGAFAHDPAIAGRSHYLQGPWVFARMAGVFAAWILFAWFFRRTSWHQDRHPELSLMLHQRLNRYSVLFVLVFAVSFSIGAFDWLISLDPGWFSTMFAVYVFAGTFVQGIAAVTLAVVLLKDTPLLRDFITPHQLHDLGKMLFAFSTFWAYIWTCQYLLIWYGNIPDEISHYLKRTSGPWLYLFALNLIVNWIVPFLALVSVAAKRNPQTLKIVSLLLLAGHWLDLYLLIMPETWSAPKMGLFEVVIAAGYMSLLYLVFAHSLRQSPLVPLNDPILAYERLHHAHS
ncbi:MAG: hypothetical protein LAP21_09845 [Acidobacteriia bacterium]|nr:hypothetical protein [Terriglobia bacterium]